MILKDVVMKNEPLSKVENPKGSPIGSSEGTWGGPGWAAHLSP